MTKKIECQHKDFQGSKSVRVKIIKAPLVDSMELRRIIFARAKAVVL